MPIPNLNTNPIPTSNPTHKCKYKRNQDPKPMPKAMTGSFSVGIWYLNFVNPHVGTSTRFGKIILTYVLTTMINYKSDC